MSVPEISTEPTPWLCASCNLPLEPRQITVSYLENAYQVELLTCKKCGLVLVTEELALGKMAEVEQTLEDK